MEYDLLYKIRHTTAHILAAAVLQRFPHAKIAIGPCIEQGFYYDFELEESLNMDILSELEIAMKKIIDEKHAITMHTITRADAYALFAEQKQQYKLELLDAISDDEDITIYTVADFVDLCRGPHVQNTREIHSKAFKLLSVTGAYWRGDEKNVMLQRIYGTAWKTPADLKAHLNFLEEVKKRDHRRIGKDMDLFSLHDDAGAGLVYWHPKGARIRHEIETFWKQEHFVNGYELLYTPHIGKSWLWETSGHLDFYADSMFNPIEMDKSDYYMKPMNCPFHIMIYRNTKYSYRDLPKRWCEFGTVYRYEKSGALHGLMRVRGFTQDDAHIFCTPEQIESEIIEALRFSLHMLRSFGFTDFHICLSTRPLESVGSDEDWTYAENSLRIAIDSEGLSYTINEGDGAFYGPKIDIIIKDALGRQWQLSTIQFDFNLPERFNLTFVDRDGLEKRPIMVHRALLGSLERFFGVLLEHYAGLLPVWLMPVQAVCIPVAACFNEYAQKIQMQLETYGIRCIVDIGDERLNAKIRKYQMQKVPYQLILGQNEVDNHTISIRMRNNKTKNELTVVDFNTLITQQIAEELQY